MCSSDLGPDNQLDSGPLKVLVTYPALGDGGFTVDNKFLYRTVYADPYFLNGINEGRHLTIFYHLCRVPTYASVNHVDDDVLFVEESVAFHLLIELSSN